VYQNFISYLYKAQHVSGDTPPIIRSLKLLAASSFAYVQQPSICAKPEADSVFRLLMMGGVSPETCSASYKYEIKFLYTVASCWISYMNYIMMHGATNITLFGQSVEFFKLKTSGTYTNC
jgi:hypothetical protein